MQAVYTSSRSYGGFTSRTDRGEPQSYEEGHALNALARGEFVGGRNLVRVGGIPVGARVRDGHPQRRNVCYDREDYQADGVHPAEAGRLKIARMMHDRLRSHAWYRP